MERVWLTLQPSFSTTGDEIELMTGGATITAYTPSIGDEQRATDTLEVVLTGTADARRTKAYQIQQRLNQAAFTTVYLNIDLTNSTAKWRSRVRGGTVAYTTATFDATGVWWPNNYSILIVTIEREDRWTQDEVLLTDASGYALTNQPGSNAYLFSKSLFVGSEQAPLRLQLTHNGGTTTPWSRVYLNAGYEQAPVNGAAVWYEGEAATGGTTTAKTNASGGNVKVIASPGDTAVLLSSYSLSAVQAAVLGGRLHNIQMRLTALASITHRFHWRLKQNGVTVYQSLETYGSATEVIDFPPFHIPLSASTPTIYVVTTALSPVTLELWGRGTGAVELDYVAIMPIDGHRILLPVAGASMGNGDSMGDDGTQVVVISGSNRYQTFQGKGQILSSPGRDLTLYVTVVNTDGRAQVNHAFTLRAWVTPTTRIL